MRNRGLDALDVDLDWGVEDEEGGQEGGWEDDRNNDAEANDNDNGNGGQSAA